GEGPSQGANSTEVRPVVSAARHNHAARTAAGVVVAAAIAFGIFYARRGLVTESPAVRFVVAPPPRYTLRLPNGAWTPTVSPDGRHLATLVNRTGTGLIWVRSLDSLEGQVLPGTEGAAATPFWSPDSHSLGFVSDGTLKTIDVSGGPVRTLCKVSRGF